MTKSLIEHQTNLRQTKTNWVVGCELVDHEITTGVGVAKQKQLIGFNLNPIEQSPYLAPLNLHFNERREYKTNISDGHPKLFVVIEHPEHPESFTLLTVTASPKLARRYRDMNHLVLSHDMPTEIINWIDSFLTA
jgi:hypothetical protein